MEFRADITSLAAIIRYSLVMGGVVADLARPAIAQEVAGPGTVESPIKVFVTGSNIPTVARESALPWLQGRLAGNELSLSLQPRELMQWALNNLHPLVLANMVNLPFSHNTDSNRLFWRVDGSTILGRFYLMHMLCVRPEVTDFVIGSSCDYSFIPEMCPSGNIDIITDSDEYLVIEMQTRNHESKFLRPGPFEAVSLAKSLSEWTTSVHRDNAKHSLLFNTNHILEEINRRLHVTED
jgi:hypothetical protein